MIHENIKAKAFTERLEHKEVHVALISHTSQLETPRLLLLHVIRTSHYLSQLHSSVVIHFWVQTRQTLRVQIPSALLPAVSINAAPTDLL